MFVVIENLKTILIDTIDQNRMIVQLEGITTVHNERKFELEFQLKAQSTFPLKPLCIRRTHNCFVNMYKAEGLLHVYARSWEQYIRIFLI